MQEPEGHRFKNIATQRFHDYFYPKVSRKEIDAGDFFDAMGVQVNVNNRLIFFSGMRLGQRSITLEHLQAAWERYGISPNYFFGLSEEPISQIAEPDQVYRKSVANEISKIRKILDSLEKKLENS